MNSFRERRVDILDEDEASIGNEREDLLQTIVGETSFGEVEEADVVGEESGESLDVGGFPGAWRTVKEVASAIRDTWKTIDRGEAGQDRLLDGYASEREKRRAHLDRRTTSPSP